jgi:hypothetical protein
MQKFYVPIKDQAETARMQKEIAEKQTRIQDEQTNISKTQARLLGDQNEILKLQNAPVFSIRENEQETKNSRFRVIDIYNTGSAVREFQARMFSSLRVDLIRKRTGQELTFYICFREGEAYYSKSRTSEIVGQMRSHFEHELVERVISKVKLDWKTMNPAEFQIKHIEEADWFVIKYKTRFDPSSSGPTPEFTQLGGNRAYSNSSIFIPRAVRDGMFNDASLKRDDREVKMSEFLNDHNYLFESDIEQASQLVFDYINQSRNCKSPSLISFSDENNSTIMQVLDHNGEIDDRLVAKLQQPAVCKKLNTTITINSAGKYVWSFSE